MYKDDLISGFYKAASDLGWPESEASAMLKEALDDLGYTGIFNNISTGNAKPATPIENPLDNNAVNNQLKEQQELEALKAQLYPK